MVVPSSVKCVGHHFTLLGLRIRQSFWSHFYNIIAIYLAYSSDVQCCPQSVFPPKGYGLDDKMRSDDEVVLAIEEAPT